jgi:hypothetical protein
MIANVEVKEYVEIKNVKIFQIHLIQLINVQINGVMKITFLYMEREKIVKEIVATALD